MISTWATKLKGEKAERFLKILTHPDFEVLVECLEMHRGAEMSALVKNSDAVVMHRLQGSIKTTEDLIYLKDKHLAWLEAKKKK